MRDIVAEQKLNGAEELLDQELEATSSHCRIKRANEAAWENGRRRRQWSVGGRLKRRPRRLAAFTPL